MPPQSLIVQWKKFLLPFFVLIGILCLGYFFRSFNRSWDQNAHLNPDERFLTMVGNASKLPTSFSQYLNPETSLLNPRNVNFSFYVYGNFPVIVNTHLSHWLDMNNYQDFTLLGRTVSAILDTAVILIIFLILWQIEKKYSLSKWIKYLSALLYALAVLPIQLSHFFSVDSFTQFFGWLAIYFALRFHLNSKQTLSILLAGIFSGLAIASKISGILFLPLVTALLFRFHDLHFPLQKKSVVRLALHTALIAVVFCWFTYFTVRLASPYYFANDNIFSLHLHPKFIANLKELQGWNNPNIWFPPGVQWVSATPLLPIHNIVRYGLGIPFSAFSFVGVLWLMKKMWKWKLRRPFFFLMIGWSIVFLLYYSFSYVKTMRYFLTLYPVFAIFGAFGIYNFSHFLTKLFTTGVRQKNQILRDVGSTAPALNLAPSTNFPKYLFSFVTAVSIILIMVWPLAFLSIYVTPHARIQASDWVYRTLPEHAVLAKEHWDDGIPFGTAPVSKKFNGVELGVFNQDSEEKMKMLNEQLATTDYYILSSNRAWKSISDAPQKYPLMSEFYSKLFKNQTEFRLVKEFHSYPSLRYLGIPVDFDDSNAEEAFTVYDHPTVYIFEKKEE